MNHLSPLGSSVLAVRLIGKGFAYVFFDEALAPRDWGIKDARGDDKNEDTLRQIKSLIDLYRPESLVVADHTEKGPGNSPRISKLYRLLMKLAKDEYVEPFHYPKSAIRKCFEPVGASTKREMISAIIREIPVFIGFQPKRRRTWDPIDPKQWLFDAIALGFTHYSMQGVPIWRTM